MTFPSRRWLRLSCPELSTDERPPGFSTRCGRWDTKAGVGDASRQGGQDGDQGLLPPAGRGGADDDRLAHVHGEGGLNEVAVVALVEPEAVDEQLLAVGAAR